MSQKEYVDDFLEPLNHGPELNPGVFALGIIPIIGVIAIGCILHHYTQKTKTYIRNVFDQFNEKYEKSRGVHMSLTDTLHQTENGQAMRRAILIKVKQPGVPIPGVLLFTLSEEGFMAVHAYQNGMHTGEPMATPAPDGTTFMAPAAYGTPAGVPQASDAVNPSMPYPM